jgi:hypothetical protein
MSEYTAEQMFAASLPRLVGDPIDYLKRPFFALAVSEGVPLNGFDGAVAPQDAAILDETVPEGFPDSVVLDLDGEALCQKTWGEYSAVLTCGDGMVMLEVGGVNEAGNRPAKPDDAEARLWIEHFGVDNILLPSEIADARAEHAGEGDE